MKNLMKRTGIVLLATLISIIFINRVGAVDDSSRPFGDSRVFTTLPASPGFPESIAVNGNKVYVGGPAAFGTAGTGPSKILVYDVRTGAFLTEYVIQGQDLSQEHVVAGIAFDSEDRLYAVETQQGILRLSLDGQTQEVYAPPLPNLPTCSSVTPGTPCSPTAIDNIPIPNEIVFDKDGNLYLTDSFQATIWRIPPGGGQPQIWFQDSRLDSPFFGPNGMRIDPSETKLYFAQTVTFTGSGRIYTLPLVNQPTASDLNLFYEYPFEGPDGIAFGESGKLYVALAITNQVSVLNPNGTEQTRFSGPAAHDPMPIPYDAPSAIAFDNRNGWLLVTNHAIFSAIPDHFAVFDIVVNDKGAMLAKPKIK